MNKLKLLSISTFSVFILLILSAGSGFATPQEDLGELLYFDEGLSNPAGQSCASCHDPDFGFADPDQELPVSEGVIPGQFGDRNSPSAAYAMFFPEFTLKKGIRGGQFWDGRAANLAEQAKGPFLNPVEMANTTKGQVIDKIQLSDYENLFEIVCGDGTDIEASYDCMADAIAAFEMTEQFFKFNSKFDLAEAGELELTPLEEQGRALFSSRGKCGHCHPDNSNPTIFTDFKFHNLGLPSNQVIFELREEEFVDLGLGGFLNDPSEDGRFKSPHLRNIDLTPPYMHNGVLETLWEVVHFYNTRDVLPTCDPNNSDADEFAVECWPAPEVPDNMDSSFMGNLGLTFEEEMAIVAFMQTFTDDYELPAVEMICNDSTDNDEDGFIDCDDSDCDEDPLCQVTGVTCEEVTDRTQCRSYPDCQWKRGSCLTR